MIQCSSPLCKIKGTAAAIQSTKGQSISRTSSFIFCRIKQTKHFLSGMLLFVDGRVYGWCSVGCHSNWVNITLICGFAEIWDKETLLSQDPTTVELVQSMIDSYHQNIERKRAAKGPRVMTKYTSHREETDTPTHFSRQCRPPYLPLIKTL